MSSHDELAASKVQIIGAPAALATPLIAYVVLAAVPIWAAIPVDVIRAVRAPLLVTAPEPASTLPWFAARATGTQFDPLVQFVRLHRD